jgi:phosphatidylglycerol---prolipoprotein diacylglyceryl transferase
MLAVAMLICSFLLSWEAKKKGISPEIMVDLIFWVALWGILGSRFFYVMLNTSVFLKDPWQIVMVHQGGLAWQGGLVFGILSGFLFIRQKKLLFWPTLDLVAPYIALGQAIGRLGCFLNGCCFGRPVSWGVYFPVHQDVLHPTQLYSAGNLFVIFLFLTFLKKFHHAQGTIFFWYLILASLERFFVQFLRADYYPLWWGLGIYQIVNLLTIFVALIFYARTYFNRRP